MAGSRRRGASDLSIIVLISPNGAPDAAFFQQLRALAPAFAERSGGRVRLLLADVDQSPLLGNGVNQTRPHTLAAALLIEGEADGSDPGRHPSLAALGHCRSYRVRARRVKGAGTLPLGPSPGFAMVSPVFRAADMSHSQFDAHWRERHAPLAIRHHIGMYRYHQYVVEGLLSPNAERFDGIAMLHFETVEDFEQRLFDSDDGRRIIMQDTRRFLSLDRSEAALMSDTGL